MKKRLFGLLALLVLLPAMAATALAAQTLELSDSLDADAKTLLVTVALPTPVQADTLGITYTYDSAVLEPLPARCLWTPGGTLADFSSQKAIGAWTGPTRELKGEVCTLAFRVKNSAAGSTRVGCSLTVKLGSQVLATHTAEHSVSSLCAHEYTESWQNTGDTFHSRSCKHCGQVEHSPHIWGSSVVSQDPKNAAMSLHTFTCSGCQAVRSVSLPISGTLPDDAFPQPTQPAPTAPTGPQPTRPQQGGQGKPGDMPGPGQSGSEQSGGSTLPQQNQQTIVLPGQNGQQIIVIPEADGSQTVILQDSDGTQTLIPQDGKGQPTVIRPADTNPSATEAHDHDHSQTVPLPANNSPILFVVLLAVALFCAGSLFYLRKKH